VDRASALLADCEQDYAMMAGWFGGLSLPYPTPVTVNILAARFNCPAVKASRILIDLWRTVPGGGSSTAPPLCVALRDVAIDA